MRRGWVRAVVALVAIDLGGCGKAQPAPRVEASAVPASASSGVPSKPDPRQACQQRHREVMALRAEPGAPAFEAHRAELLARGKGAPVVFRRAPRVAPPEHLLAAGFRQRLAREEGAQYALIRIYKHLAKDPALAREVLLREGYLYAENGDLAAGLTRMVRLRHLFRDPELLLERGGRRHWLRRVPGRRGTRTRYGRTTHYVHVGGPLDGRRATLQFLDRVWSAATAEAPPLHIDVRPAAADAAGDRLRIDRITASAIAAHVRFGDRWAPAVLRVDGTTAHLECLAPSAADDAAVARARDIERRRARVLTHLRKAIDVAVRERLPFDEPRTEEGQQDGNLRPRWLWAYRHGLSAYKFNDDSYRVFDGQGRPKVPQVCVDFVTDSLERAAGSWWTPQGQERRRTPGRLSFNDLDIENRRSVEVLIGFAWEHPELFDTYSLISKERIPFWKRREFYAHLAAHPDRYRPGDIIAILGPKGAEYHYHSFFIVEADPVTGMPLKTASNAGRPRIRSWESEMLSGPRRSIKARLRPRLEWLEGAFFERPVAEAGARTTPPSGASPSPDGTG